MSSPASSGSVSEDALRDQLAKALAQVSALQDELDETNRGVVALYAELDEQAIQLKQATELKSRFLAYMSHEFRTPVNSIRSIARLLLDRVDGPLTEEQERQVRFVQAAAVEFSEMVDDLLDLAKIEAGRVEISAAWFEMVDLFSALRGTFRPMLTNQAVTLVFEEPLGTSRIYTDDRKVSQILRNFVSNALKFTETGEVRVSAAMEGDSHVRFAVQDTGIGIAAEHQKAVFDDFAQVDSPIQKRLRGTGLGLALCRQLAMLLGGEVGVQSELGKGSTFYLLIPVQLNVEPAASEPADMLPTPSEPSP